MRRVLLLITDLKVGGTPTVVRELARRMRRWREVEVQVACLAGWGPTADQIRELPVTVTALGAQTARDLGAIGRLCKLIRGQQIDTVFSFLMHANAAAAVSGCVNREVRYIQAIQTTQRWPRWHWWVQRLIQSMAARVVVPSESVARAAEDWAGVDRRKIVVIPNAVEVAEFEGIGRAFGQGAFPIGFMGRLDPVKRVGDLLEAVGRLRGTVHLHVFGDGAERGAIETSIRRLGIGAGVTLHGVVRAQEALGRIGLLVLPSEAEGFPMVLIEAMAAGVPIVATSAPGIRDVVQDGQTGLLVAVGDVAGLAAAIGRVAGDERLRGRLVERGRREVSEKYAWERVERRYREVLGVAD